MNKEKAQSQNAIKWIYVQSTKSDFDRQSNIQVLVNFSFATDWIES